MGTPNTYTVVGTPEVQHTADLCWGDPPHHAAPPVVKQLIHLRHNHLSAQLQGSGYRLTVSMVSRVAICMRRENLSLTGQLVQEEK